jgi:hypothetical protein
MNQDTERIRNLAQKLLSYESAAGKHTEENTTLDAAGVLDALRRHLSVLSGVNGFDAIMSRALALAKAQNADLQAVQLAPDGSLRRLSEICNREPAAGVEVIAQLLGLLVTFVGESLTLRILIDAGVDANGSNADPSEGGSYDPAE